MPGSQTPRCRTQARHTACVRVVFPLNRHGRHTDRVFSEFNGRPARTPINASPRTSRPTAHDSGTERVAKPYSVQLLHLRLLAGFRRFPVPPFPHSPTLYSTSTSTSGFEPRIRIPATCAFTARRR